MIITKQLQPFDIGQNIVLYESISTLDFVLGLYILTL